MTEVTVDIELILSGRTQAKKKIKQVRGTVQCKKGKIQNTVFQIGFCSELSNRLALSCKTVGKLSNQVNRVALSCKTFTLRDPLSMI
jgi:hypothetical protein